jgi:excisionase family DNA binding protein
VAVARTRAVNLDVRVVGRDIHIADTCKPVQPSVTAAFDPRPPSSPAQPDAGERKFLAVSLLYTEVTHREEDKPLALLSAREVAQRLHVLAATVYALCQSGQLAYTRVLNAIRISPADLDEYIEAQHSS